VKEVREKTASRVVPFTEADLQQPL